MRPERIPRLYGIADLAAFGAPGLPGVVAEMAAAGLEWIQLRLKPVATDLELFRLAEACQRRLEGSSARLWINDRPDLAALLGAAGLHLGQEDLPAEVARRVVGPGCWLGTSTHDLDQLDTAEADAAVDVVALGPIFTTHSKQRPEPAIGLATLALARRRTTKPLVAIGGISAGNAPAVIAAGADTVAVISAIDPRRVGASCLELLRAVA